CGRVRAVRRRSHHAALCGAQPVSFCRADRGYASDRELAGAGRCSRLAQIGEIVPLREKEARTWPAPDEGLFFVEAKPLPTLASQPLPQGEKVNAHFARRAA